MDSRYRFMTLGIPWTQSMPSRDVNAATRLAEASWRRDKMLYTHIPDRRYKGIITPTGGHIEGRWEYTPPALFSLVI